MVLLRKSSIGTKEVFSEKIMVSGFVGKEVGLIKITYFSYLQYIGSYATGVNVINKEEIKFHKRP